MTPDTLKELIDNALRKQANTDNALQMSAYMKNKFTFYGVKSPNRRVVVTRVKQIIKQSLKEKNSLWSPEKLMQLAESLFEEGHRECHYVAVDLLVWKKKWWSGEHLPRIEKLILTHSWWDSVDSLAPNIAGYILQDMDAQRLVWINRWNQSTNLWLKRSALIHQLRYKEDTNLDLLFALVECNVGSKEFFINKASGWALRQASKYYPSEVRQFIDSHPKLSGLTMREGTKYL